MILLYFFETDSRNLSIFKMQFRLIENGLLVNRKSGFSVTQA